MCTTCGCEADWRLSDRPPTYTLWTDTGDDEMPVSDALPLQLEYLASAGIGILASRDDHVHPIGDLLVDGRIDVTAGPYFAVGDGLTDDGPAIRSALAVAVAQTANGKSCELFFPDGKIYYCNTVGEAAALTITRDNTRSRGRLRIAGGAGTVIKLSNNTPRFIDFERVADHDLFYNLEVCDLTLDANNVGGQHHLILGNYRLGVIADRMNWDTLIVRRVQTINVQTDFVTGSFFAPPDNHRLNIYLATQQQAAGEGTTNYIKNVRIEDLTMNGGNQGLVIVGVAAGPGNLGGYNLLAENIHVTRVTHDTGVTPTVFRYSVGVHIGSSAWCRHIRVRDSFVKGQADDGFEINGGEDMIIDSCVAVNQMYFPYFFTNYHGGVTAPATYGGARLQILNCRVLYDSDMDAANSIGQRTGFGIAYPDATAKLHNTSRYRSIIMRDCTFEIQTHRMSLSVLSGGINCIALYATDHFLMDGYEIRATDLEFDHPADVDTIKNFSSLNGININSQVSGMTAELRNIYMDLVTSKSSTGVQAFRAVYAQGPALNLQVDGVRYAHEHTGTPLSAGDVRPIYLGVDGRVLGVIPPGFVKHGLRGGVKGLRLISLGGDVGCNGITIGESALCDITGMFKISECDLLEVANGVDVNVVINGTDPNNGAKVEIRNCDRAAWRLATLSIILTASPFIWQNVYAAPMMVTILGGTVSDISHSPVGDGVTFTPIASTTDQHFLVDVGAYLMVTYSVLPFMKRINIR